MAAIFDHLQTPERNRETDSDGRIKRAILLIRGEKVVLDSELAAIYGVETGALNRAVERTTN